MSCRLSVRVRPAARSTRVSGPRPDGAIGVEVAAPAERGRANEAVVRLFADLLGCPRANISILRGETSRHKVVLVRGLSADRLASALGHT